MRRETGDKGIRQLANVRMVVVASETPNSAPLRETL